MVLSPLAKCASNRIDIASHVLQNDKLHRCHGNYYVKKFDARSFSPELPNSKLFVMKNVTMYHAEILNCGGTLLDLPYELSTIHLLFLVGLLTTQTSQSCNALVLSVFVGLGVQHLYLF